LHRCKFHIILNIRTASYKKQKYIKKGKEVRPWLPAVRLGQEAGTLLITAVNALRFLRSLGLRHKAVLCSGAI